MSISVIKTISETSLKTVQTWIQPHHCWAPTAPSTKTHSESSQPFEIRACKEILKYSNGPLVCPLFLSCINNFWMKCGHFRNYDLIHSFFWKISQSSQWQLTSNVCFQRTIGISNEMYFAIEFNKIS